MLWRLIARNLVSATLSSLFPRILQSCVSYCRATALWLESSFVRIRAPLFVRLLREFNRIYHRPSRWSRLPFWIKPSVWVFMWINKQIWIKQYSCDFYNYLKLSQATVSQVISMSFWSLVASSDANNANSCRSLYGSWRIARYLDADNSFVPCCLALPLLLHHLCTLCYSPCLLLLRVFLLFSSSVEQRPFRTRLCRLHNFGATHARMHLYFITVNHWHSFFPSFFSFLPQLHGWPHSVDTCMIFVFL